MNLKIKHFVIIITIVLSFSCRRQERQILSEIRGKQIKISDSMAPLDSIETFVSPYRSRINKVLDSTLAYAPYMISKTDGVYNTTAGNLMADIVLEEADPVFKSRTGKPIDFVVLNHGGIRSIISQGNVSARSAYEVMPFDNSIVVVALKGKSVRELVAYLIRSDRPNPVAGIQIVLNRDNSLRSVNINKAPFDENRTYYVATSSYLAEGGDNMGFFKDGLNITETNYLIRNALIDYFKKADTIVPVVDDRFMKLN